MGYHSGMIDLLTAGILSRTVILDCYKYCYHDTNFSILSEHLSIQKYSKSSFLTANYTA
jgi:hypothetical protein